MSDNLFEKFYTNEEKPMFIKTSTGFYARSSIGTHFIRVGESLVELMEKYVKPMYREGDIVTLSAKVVSLCQKNIVYKKDMKLSKLAKFLSRFAGTSEAGIGVDNAWKMQFAIDFCGTGKVIWASVCAAVGRVFGKRGLFYSIMGEEVRGLDGFYDKCFEEYGNFGIMLPREPAAACEKVYESTGILTMVIDANDFSQDVLGWCSKLDYSAKELREFIIDNPASNGNEMTPFVLIRKIEESMIPEGAELGTRIIE